MKNKKYILCMLGMVMTMVCMSGCGKAANDIQESYEESGSTGKRTRENREGGHRNTARLQIQL